MGENVMRIGELAAQVGATRDTIRFYEKLGLITATRLANGYRDYPPEAAAWLRHVRTAQRLGFSLAEIAQVVEQLRGAPDEDLALSALLAEKARTVDERMAALEALRSDLAARIGTACPLRHS
ncbi:MerR family transcriptional regulator [Winogradskya humida]|uniref:MerR family transcriptional regulator n=2 Tax=Winogradskya humida TaxID=113566 RepID=A0ABQ3ZUR4_9ACTN|nr:MerR family transcriptional regulator [Actinoplanes humidus]